VRVEEGRALAGDPRLVSLQRLEDAEESGEGVEADATGAALYGGEFHLEGAVGTETYDN